jgi:hypothetical protein
MVIWWYRGGQMIWFIAAVVLVLLVDQWRTPWNTVTTVVVVKMKRPAAFLCRSNSEEDGLYKPRDLFCESIIWVQLKNGDEYSVPVSDHMYDSISEGEGLELIIRKGRLTGCVLPQVRYSHSLEHGSLDHLMGTDLT